jgi:hypothetical protein
MGPKTRKAARSAKNGRFVTEEFAKKHPKTTVIETIKNAPQKKKSK